MAQILEVSRALSDKNRIRILQILSDGETNVSTVAEDLRVEENLASHHLRVLASLGFLKNRKKGRQVFYQLNKKNLIRLFKDLKNNPAFREILEEAISE